jgi:glucosamine-6-phosphate deaminase
VAEIVAEQLGQKKDSCLGLPTGRTPVGCYRWLCQWSAEGKIDWSRAKAFQLDEYYDVDPAHSFQGYLERNLFDGISVPASRRFNPLLVDDYDAEIQLHGGLDLTLLGIGKNGHIAFNEPGTPADSWTHSVILTESTRQANAEFFKQADQIPRRACTMGIRTILASKRIILIASGNAKKEILESALSGPVTDKVPASFLQLHKQVTVVTDFEV